jgi:hypothetical protein
MPQDTEIRLFEEQKIRTHWDEKSEEWYFSVIDVVEVLTESANVQSLFRIIQSIPSPKAEPFKQWLLTAGKRSDPYKR